ncbi:hypothetical protein BSF41_25300 [Flavobacterium sp. ACN2]|uniref:hypothetical protein n=1 Tax=Flavobacterium sp. ACN2 TaxID=1975676 RepID=UPI000BB30105|nr:hypothetical protein [Flavobacterium sp. ACN2]PBI88402.1 hypothetical protein BSF41_25300 [Flavobacterium sp. ACN2]
MIIIKLEENILNFYKDSIESPIYSIRKAELPIVINENGYSISEWINHLMTKTWIEENILYELASLIQKEFPNNKIDWTETFFPVEKRLYLRHVKSTNNLLSNDKSKKLTFKNLMESVQIGIEEQNDFVNNEVLKIVDINLKKVGLK